MLHCPTLAELVIVGLQQGLGDIPWLTAGQVLTGALLWLAAAATATSVTAAAAAAAAAWQVSIVLRGKKSQRQSAENFEEQPSLLYPARQLFHPSHLLFPVLLGLLLKEETDLLEGGSLGRLQVPAGLHDAVSGDRTKFAHVRAYQ